MNCGEQIDARCVYMCACLKCVFEGWPFRLIHPFFCFLDSSGLSFTPNRPGVAAEEEDDDNESSSSSISMSSAELSALVSRLEAVAIKLEGVSGGGKQAAAGKKRDCRVLSAVRKSLG